MHRCAGRRSGDRDAGGAGGCHACTNGDRHADANSQARTNGDRNACTICGRHADGDSYTIAYSNTYGVRARDAVADP